MRIRHLPLLLSAALVPALFAGEPAPGPDRPFGFAMRGDGTLIVGTRGGLVVLDPRTRKILDRFRIGTNNVAMSAVGDRIVLLADDELVSVDARAGKETARQKLGLSAVDVVLHPDRRRVSVACLWPRQLWLLDTEHGPIAKIDLPFAPRKQILSPNGRHLVVADAFAGKIGLVDLDRKSLLSVRELPDVHNIRGLAWSRDGRSLWVTHQNLHKQGHPNATDIRAGNVVSNHLRKLAALSVLDPAVDIFRDEILYTLGDVEAGAGDPADVVELADGRIAVALAGVGEVAVGRPQQVLWNRIPVGQGPEALAVVEGKLFVAERFDDSVAAIDLTSAKVERIRLGATDRPATAIERGEIAFFDARHSLEGWYSCHSCHSYGHTSGRLNDNFTDGSFGTPKRVLSLLGARDTGPWAWSGQIGSLEEQTRNSIKSTMQGVKQPPHELVDDLTAYLRSLPPAPGVRKARGESDPEIEKRGRKIFVREKCGSCHAPPTYTSPKAYDVGLVDEVGGKLFNPPSLRGVSQAGPYFHDGRAMTLEDVFSKHRHELARPLTAAELGDLVYWLRGL
jgi:hypothetical protein